MSSQDKTPMPLEWRERPAAGRHARKNRIRRSWFGVCAKRYRSLKRRIDAMLGRGDRDYSTLTALSQEIGGMRRRIREGLHRRREARRKRRSAAQAKRFAT
jgi:hypothetical protein